MYNISEEYKTFLVPYNFEIVFKLSNLKVITSFMKLSNSIYS